jgi:hypothetical protein
MTTIVVCALLGAVLGLRFTAFVLVPTAVMCVAAIALGAILHHDDLWRWVSAIIESQIGLQLGFLATVAAQQLQEDLSPRQHN